MNRLERTSSLLGNLLPHLIVLGVAMALVCLAALAVNSSIEDPKPLRIDRAEVVARTPLSSSLVFHGQGVHGGVRVLQAERMIDDDAALWHHLEGLSVQALVVKGSLALASCLQRRLVSLDLSGPGGAKLLGSLDLPDDVRTIEIIGQRAFVGLSTGSGLAVVDLTNPEKMVLLALYQLTGPVTSMAVDGSDLYFTDMSSGVYRIRGTADDAVPQRVAALHKPWQITLSGRRMVVTTISGDLHLFDLIRHELKAVGLIPGAAFSRGDVRGVAMTEESLTVALVNRTARVFPLAQWPNLEQYVELNLPGMPFAMVPVADDETVCVSLVAGGVVLMDVSQPLVPVLAGYLRLPGTLLAMQPANGVLYASVQTRKRGLAAFPLQRIKDSRNDVTPLVADAYHTFWVWDGELYGYRRDKVLVDFGLRSPSHDSVPGPLLMTVDNDGVGLFQRDQEGLVQRLGSLVDEKWLIAAVATDEAVFFLHRRGLRVMTGDDVLALGEVGSLEISGRPSDVKIFKPGYVLVTTRDEGLKVIDVSDLSNPRQVAKLEPPSHLSSSNVAHDVFVKGDVAYVSQGLGGVYVVGLSVPEKPRLLEIIDTPGVAMKFANHEDLLLVSDGNEGVFMIDLHDPQQPRAIGTLPTPMRASEIVAVRDGFMISSYPADNTMKIPFPKEVETANILDENRLQVDLPGDARSGYAYFYDGRSMSRLQIDEED